MLSHALALALTLAGGPAAPGAIPAAPVPAADSVRELHVVILIHTRSFARTLDAAQMERLHEEIVEFAEFYRRHGGDRVSFRFTLVQSDRQLRRFEVEEVAPGRHYLSRTDVQAELQSLGLGSGDVDEVVAFYAWSNANPDGAVLAYGGGAVGPDGNFLGDAGYNSIGVFAFDPARIAQIAIHEVLHNVDDMFSRAGMSDDFLNSDEMSRNMATLLAERPGAFEPFHDDPEMLAYAERERAGRDAYPWWMQRIYYAWMLERTPAEAWSALRHGRMVPLAPTRGVRPLFDDVLVSRATTRLFLTALARDTASTRAPVAGGARGALTPRRWALEDFDGTPIAEGDYFGGWIDLDGTDTVAVLAIGDGTTTVHRLQLGDIESPARVAALVGEDAAFDVVAREAGWPERGPIVGGAAVAAVAPNEPPHRGTGTLRVPLPDSPGSTWFDVGAVAEGFVFPGARVEAVREAAWSVDAPSSRETAMHTPLGLRIGVRERRPLDARVIARLPGGGEAVLIRAPDGSYAGELDGLPPGLHDIELVALRPGGDVVVDTLRVYARPSGWIRVPRRIEAEDGRVTVEASVRTRMGTAFEAAALPLVAIVGARVVPIEFAAGTYRALVDLPPGEHRLYVTSLTGDFQRRVVLASSRGGAVGGAVAVPEASMATSVPFLAAPRMTAEPVLDGVPDAVPGQRLLQIGTTSHVLTSPTAGAYSGAADLDAQIGMAWREDGLYVSGTVRDDDVTMGEAWDRDRINLVFDWREDTTPLTYASDSPPTAEWQADDYWVFFQPFDADGGPGSVRRIGRDGQRTLAGARLASSRTEEGYTFEAWIPAAELPEFVPFEAQVAGLQLFVSDGDTGQPLTELLWSHAWAHSPDGGLAWELSRMGRLVFTGAPLR